MFLSVDLSLGMLIQLPDYAQHYILGVKSLTGGTLDHLERLIS